MKNLHQPVISPFTFKTSFSNHDNIEKPVEWLYYYAHKLHDVHREYILNYWQNLLLASRHGRHPMIENCMQINYMVQV